VDGFDSSHGPAASRRAQINSTVGSGRPTSDAFWRHRGGGDGRCRPGRPPELAPFTGLSARGPAAAAAFVAGGPAGPGKVAPHGQTWPWSASRWPKRPLQRRRGLRRRRRCGASTGNGSAQQRVFDEARYFTPSDDPGSLFRRQRCAGGGVDLRDVWFPRGRSPPAAGGAELAVISMLPLLRGPPRRAGDDLATGPPTTPSRSSMSTRRRPGELVFDGGRRSNDEFRATSWPGPGSSKRTLVVDSTSAHLPQATPPTPGAGPAAAAARGSTSPRAALRPSPARSGPARPRLAPRKRCGRPCASAPADYVTRTAFSNVRHRPLGRIGLRRGGGGSSRRPRPDQRDRRLMPSRYSSDHTSPTPRLWPPTSGSGP